MEANLSLYELNRSIIAQQGTLDVSLVHEKMDMIKKFAEDTNNKFYMLYGREISYFTIFTHDENWEVETLSQAVGECLLNIGLIYSIELTKEKDAIEIWVETPPEGDTDGILTCLYLFPYDNGIVRIK